MVVNILILLGTFLPIFGLVFTFGLAFYSAKLKWFVLFLGPLVTLLLCVVFGDRIGFNGNMLFVVILGGYLIFLLGYYPILFIVAVWTFIRQRKNRKSVFPN